MPYLVFASIGFFAIVTTRLVPFQNKLPTFVLALVHGILPG